MIDDDVVVVALFKVITLGKKYENSRPDTSANIIVFLQTLLCLTSCFVMSFSSMYLLSYVYDGVVIGSRCY